MYDEAKTERGGGRLLYRLHVSPLGVKSIQNLLCVLLKWRI